MKSADDWGKDNHSDHPQYDTSAYRWDDYPVRVGSTLEKECDLFVQMLHEAAAMKRKKNLLRNLPPVKPSHHTFVKYATMAAPPFHDFGGPLDLHYFDGTEFKSSDYIVVNPRRHLQAWCDLEYEMTKWYNEFYFENKMYERKNWWRVWIGGFNAAYIPSRDTWCRAWVCDRVYSNDLHEYQCGSFDVLVYLIDYGVPDLVPRRYLLPLKQEYIELPFMSYIASIEREPGVDVGENEANHLMYVIEKKTFQGFVTSTHTLADLPYQVLKIKLLTRTADSTDSVSRLHHYC